MRNQKTNLIAVAFLFSAFWMGLHSPLRAIENDPNKEYVLNEKYGPWMIMVTTFSDVNSDKKNEGLTAQQAGQKLVHELRAKGIPAYVYYQDSKKEKIDTFDRLGNKDQRVYTSKNDMVGVLAGNYSSIDDPIAQDTLAKIKKFRPKFLADPKSVGAVIRVSGQKGPFYNAMLTINPTLKPTDIVRRKVDNETKYFNSGIDYPLVNLKKKYTLKIATFSGKSVVPVANSKFNGKESNFDKMIADAGPYNLARAGEDATQLTYALRQNNEATRKLGQNKFEAYVYHDKFQSIVTVGGFDSENDPDVKRLAQIFVAKYEPNDDSDYSLVARSISLPGKDPKGPPVQTWVFDPVPELIEVPHLK